ncbi:penicillin-binding protein 1B [Arenimonas sp. MALMAid1274]|uniref:penicillin-binding protein 1B n=1 Tax=Arenimonas sp. MALMAid1274 TaxID=3411630 RepID=UPI003BA29992
MSVPRSAPPKKSDTETARPRWRGWLWRGALLALGLALGVGVPVLWMFDKQVRSEFDQLAWQVPTRVYARPLRLAPGLRLDAATLELELAASGYRKDGSGDLPGTYARNGGRFHIGTRAYTDLDGVVPAQRLEVDLAGGKVARLADRRAARALESARIDPSRIATLYGGNVQEERRLVQLKEVPTLFVAGLQAVEDRNFKDHHGIDPWGMTRAMWVNVREGELEQGASTLTQQLVRSLFLTREKRFSRKFKEIAYSLIIEARYDKRRIMEAYLNQVYLGQQGNQSIHGVAAASEFWFGRELASLSTQDMALLVGMIQGPSIHDPRRKPEAAKARRDLVLSVWQQLGLIDAAEAKRAKAAPLGVTARPGVARNRNPAFMDLVRRQLARDYPADALRGAGLSVLTTLSPSAQLLSEQAVSGTLAKVQRKDGPSLQSGMVVTDTHTGEVLAMVGNRATDQPGFNRALEAQRPVGSLLKPMVYLLALAQPNRWSLATPVDDSPVNVTLPNGKSWNPGNSDGRSHGTVSLVDALAQSYNQATVRVGMDVGPERLAELLKVLAGLRAPANPSLILGSVDLSPFAMAQVYQFLASGGEIQPLRAVRGVIDPQGKAINRYDFEAEPAKEGDAIAARLVTLALQDAVSRGTGRSLLSDGLGSLNIAGKTGTSNDSRDSWFAGYTGDHLAVVWVGNDKNEPTGLYGATGAMRVWSALFTKLPSAPLNVGAAGLEWGWVDAAQFATTEENCEGARRYAFVAGYLPPEHVSCVDRSWLDWFRFGGDDGQQERRDRRDEERRERRDEERRE